MDQIDKHDQALTELLAQQGSREREVKLWGRWTPTASSNMVETAEVSAERGDKVAYEDWGRLS